MSGPAIIEIGTYKVREGTDKEYDKYEGQKPFLLSSKMDGGDVAPDLALSASNQPGPG